MTPAEYRARVLAEIAAVPSQAVSDEPSIPELLARAVDPSAPAQERAAALSSAHSATFFAEKFAPHKATWRGALRTLVDDPEPELARKALGLLAQEGDGFGQERLLDGLRDPTQAVLRPEEALELLGADLHTEVVPLARAILRTTSTPAARLAAVRVLGSDPGSVIALDSIAADRDEPPHLRQMALAGLHALSPEHLRVRARQIVLEPDESDDVLATSMVALATGALTAPDAEIEGRATALRTAGSRSVRAAARRLHTKLPPKA